MSILDYILLGLIVLYSLYLILRKKKPECGGNCAHCRANCKNK